MSIDAVAESAAGDRAALLEVAKLVAGGAAEADAHAAVAEHAGSRLGGDASSVLRFLGDERAVVVGTWWAPGVRGIPVNAELDFDHRTSALGRVRRFGRASRAETYEGVAGELAVVMRSIGLRSSVATPVVAAGEVWGALVVASVREEPLGADAEERLAAFAALAGAAVDRAAEREELEASRLRLVHADDEARRRLEHALHEGTQQHLLALTLKLRVARAAADPALVDDALRDAMDANTMLRELAREIYPKVLSERGLAAALQALAARSPVPVHLRELPSRRFEPLVESTAYFLAAEALRDAGTPPAADEISLLVADRGDRLEVELRCSAAGAPREPGPTVLGFRDRVGALGGSLAAEPGSVRAELPVTR